MCVVCVCVCVCGVCMYADTLVCVQEQYGRLVEVRTI